MSGVVYDSGWLTLTVWVEQRPPSGVFTNTVVIDDETDTPPDDDDEPTRVPDASFDLGKERITFSPVDVGATVQFLIAITNTGALTITRLPLEDTYDTQYLGYVNALPTPDTVVPGMLRWNDLTAGVTGTDLAPGESVQVLVEFVAITSTQHLSPPVTINTAVSDGAETAVGVLPPEQDDAEVEIEVGGSTAIELLYWRGKPKAGGVLLEWATLFEIDTYGYWIYRSESVELSQAEPIAFVAAKGWWGLGARYEYYDAGLAKGVYHYWLVEVENSGKETAYGPVSTWSGWDEGDLPYRIFLPLVRQG
jgi:hypothetical protein